jgi:hypothetical protein
MTESALSRLLARARGPLGPQVSVNFETDSGPLYELGQMLSKMNGFFAFNAGLQVYRAGEKGEGPELLSWNSAELWKHSYDGFADEFFCFGQDILGTQYAIRGGTEVVQFDPENCSATHIGASLEAWAEWVFSNPDRHATAFLAKVWQDEKGALAPNERLVPLRFFVMGGEVSFDNLVVKDSVEAMIIRGPIASQIHDLPPGSTIRLGVE